MNLLALPWWQSLRHKSPSPSRQTLRSYKRENRPLTELRRPQGLNVILNFLHNFTISFTYVTVADDVNLLGDNIDTTNKYRETLIVASKEVGLDVKTNKTNSVALSPQGNYAD
jgi:hypothetical protein